MIEPIIENIEQVLTGLADETLNRHEAVAWGEAVYQQCGVSSPGGPEFKTDIKHFTNFWVVCVGALLHAGCNANGEPYFYRNHDFREWLAVLHREDAIRPANAMIWSARMHQEVTLELNQAQGQSILTPTPPTADGVDALFTRQVADFIEEYRPALETLAQ